jgi:hypothetical protein
MRTSAAAAALLALSAPARADWVIGHYRGGAATRANTVTIDRAAGAPGGNVTIASVDYDGESWKRPVYYGYRISRFFTGTPHLGLELEFTHAKAIADIGQSVSVNGTTVPLSAVMQRLELSHGLNLALANIAFRGRCARPAQVIGSCSSDVPAAA